MVYVVNQGSKTVTPVFAATRAAGRPIKVPNSPGALAAGPGGATVYVVSSNFGTGKPGFVTPIRAATNTASAPIKVGVVPSGVAVTPDGKTAWVVNETSVTPVDTATRRAGRPVRLVFNNGDHANAIVISPDGTTAYIATSFTVVPIHLVTRRAGKPIRLGNSMWTHSQIAITPGGRTLYVLTGGGLLPAPSDLFPVNTATGKAGKPITAAGMVNAIALSPGGTTLYAGSVTGKNPNYASVVVPVSTSTNKAAKPITIGRPGPNAGVSSLAVTPNGSRIAATGRST